MQIKSRYNAGMVKVTEKNYGIRIPPELREELRLLANEDARSLNAEMVWILRNYVEQRKREKEVKQERVSKT